MLLKGEISHEGDFTTAPLDVLEGHRDGLALAGGVGEVEVACGSLEVLVGVLVVGEVGRELELLVLGLEHGDRAAVDGERGEDGQGDLVEVIGARAGDDKHLKRGPGKGGRHKSQEGRLRGNLVGVDAIEAVLLAFLADDGGNQLEGNHLAFLRKQVLSSLQSSEDNGSEGLGEVDGVGKLVDGELVLACLGDKLVGGLERSLSR